MKKALLLIGILSFTMRGALVAHCQMPCGIYHDDMVYDQIDQYAETMYKAMAELDHFHDDSPKARAQFVRWVYQKEVQSDDAAELMLKYFLQQKIKPGEPETAKMLELTHKLLFLMVQIKQNVDLEFVYNFMEVWDQFKLMFHREGYECKIEKLKLKKWREEAEALRKKKAEQAQKDKNLGNGETKGS